MQAIQTILPLAHPSNPSSTGITSLNAPASSPLVSVVSSKAGISNEVSECVAKSVSGVTIRAGVAEDTEMFMLALVAELEGCAKQYTGCPNTKDLVFDEAAEFVIDQFGFLNIGEIRLAFRLAAAGEFEGVTLRAYFGTFTVGMLGEVLAAYKEYRGEAVRHFRTVENASAALQSGEERQRQHDMEAWEQNRIKFLKLLHEPTIDNCTAYDYEFLTRRGEINLTHEQKKAMLQRRFDAVVKEIHRDMDGATPYRRKEMTAEIESARKGKYSEGFKNKMVIAGRRLAVLDWINNQREPLLVIADTVDSIFREHHIDPADIKT